MPTKIVEMYLGKELDQNNSDNGNYTRLIMQGI